MKTPRLVQTRCLSSELNFNNTFLNVFWILGNKHAVMTLQSKSDEPCRLSSGKMCNKRFSLQIGQH